VILAACLLKVAVQISTDATPCSTGAVHRKRGMPCPRLAGIHWSVSRTGLPVIGLSRSRRNHGRRRQILLLVFPVYARLWALAIAATLSLLVFHGRYRPVRLIAGFLNLAFISTVLYSMPSLEYPYRFGLGEIASDSPSLPPRAGPGHGGLWHHRRRRRRDRHVSLLVPEKGYAAWTGQRDGSGLVRRARGWIRVMQLDATLSWPPTRWPPAASTSGRRRAQPTARAEHYGNLLVLQLSRIFTEVIGEARSVFMACAFTVLFSSLFSNTAGLSPSGSTCSASSK
jgi:hypothetical protein